MHNRFLHSKEGSFFLEPHDQHHLDHQKLVFFEVSGNFCNFPPNSNLSELRFEISKLYQVYSTGTRPLPDHYQVFKLENMHEWAWSLWNSKASFRLRFTSPVRSYSVVLCQVPSVSLVDIERCDWSDYHPAQTFRSRVHGRIRHSLSGSTYDQRRNWSRWYRKIINFK